MRKNHKKVAYITKKIYKFLEKGNWEITDFEIVVNILSPTDISIEMKL